MAKHAKKVKKSSGKKTSKKGGVGTSGTIRKKAVSDDRRGAKKKLAKSTTLPVRSSVRKSRNKTSGNANRQSTSGSEARDLKRLQRLFLQEVEQRELEDELQELFLKELKNEQRKRKKKSQGDSDRETGAEDTYSKESRNALRSARFKTSRNPDDTVIKMTFARIGMQKLILALNAYPFHEVATMIERIPNKVIVILGIKKPGQPSLYYMSFATPLDYSVSSVASVKQFVLQTVADYNNNMADLIDEHYDEPTQVYKIREIGIRFVYPIEII